MHQCCLWAPTVASRRTHKGLPPIKPFYKPAYLLLALRVYPFSSPRPSMVTLNALWQYFLLRAVNLSTLLFIVACTMILLQFMLILVHSVILHLLLTTNHTVSWVVLLQLNNINILRLASINLFGVCFLTQHHNCVPGIAFSNFCDIASSVHLTCCVRRSKVIEEVKAKNRKPILSSGSCGSSATYTFPVCQSHHSV